MISNLRIFFPLALAHSARLALANLQAARVWFEPIVNQTFL
jgi:hypothetical protein